MRVLIRGAVPLVYLTSSELLGIRRTWCPGRQALAMKIDAQSDWQQHDLG